MNHFMDDQIFQTLRRLPGQFGIDANVTGFRRATAPASFHLPDAKRSDSHTQHRLPTGDQRGYGLPQLLPIPGSQRLTSHRSRMGWNPQHQTLMLQRYHGRGIAFFNDQPIALALDQTAFSIQIIVRRCPHLFTQSALLLPNPIQPGNRKRPQCVKTDLTRRGKSHLPQGRVDAEAHIFDIFQHDSDGDIA